METGEYILLFSECERNGRPQCSQLKVRILLTKEEAKNGYGDRPLAGFDPTVEIGNLLGLWDMCEWLCLTAERKS